MIFTAEYDLLCEEGETYARRLEEAGVQVRLRRFDGTIHAFLSMYGVIDTAREALAELAAAIRAI